MSGGVDAQADWQEIYGYHGSLFLRSHWVIDALGEGETTMITQTRNTGLTRLKVSWLMSVRLVGWLIVFLWHKVYKGHTGPNEIK